MTELAICSVTTVTVKQNEYVGSQHFTTMGQYSPLCQAWQKNTTAYMHDTLQEAISNIKVLEGF